MYDQISAVPAARLAAAQVAALLAFLLIAPAPAGNAATTKRIAPGFDLFETAQPTSVSFSGASALPADFFGPGSRPFDDKVPLEGLSLGRFRGIPTGGTDTVVHRIDPALLPTPTSSDTIPIRIVRLSLHSIRPIKVTVGARTERWDMSAALSRTVSPRGSMTIRGRNSVGGIFDSVLPVVPRLTFRRVGDRVAKVLDLGLLPANSAIRSSLVLRARNVPYTYQPPPRLLTIAGLNDDFCAGCTRLGRRTHDHSGPQHAHVGTIPLRLDRIRRGFDVFATQPDKTVLELPKSFPIPAGFFTAGSQAFSGTIAFKGAPIGTFRGRDVGDADTLLRRSRDAVVGPARAQDTIPIELVRLSLESREPIEVEVGDSVELWDVAATVSPARRSSGTMTIRKHDESGGTFDSRLTVRPLLTFTNRATGAVRKLDLGALELPKSVAAGLVLRASGAPWRNGCAEPALHVRGLNDDFCASFTERNRAVLTEERARLAAHGIVPAQPIHLPRLDCAFEPPALMFRAGSGGDADCAIRRVEGTRSFFDVAFALESVAPQDLTVELKAPFTELARDGSVPLRVHVSAPGSAAPGSYVVRVGARERAGAADAISSFDLPVTITESSR